MAAPRIHAQTESRKPAAAITSGRVMNGPDADHLKHVEEDGGAKADAALKSGLEPGGGSGLKDMRLKRSPDCTLAVDHVSFPESFNRAMWSRRWPGLVAWPRRSGPARRAAGSAAPRMSFFRPPSPSRRCALPLPEDRGQADAGADAEAAADHGERALHRGAPRR